MPRIALLTAVAAWSIVPPYLGEAVGLTLDVPASTETIDHTIPGMTAVIASICALVLARRGEPDSVGVFALLAVGALAGLFQTVSHVSLVLDAGGPLQPVGAVALHASPGPVLLGLSLWLLLRSPPSEPPG